MDGKKDESEIYEKHHSIQKRVQSLGRMVEWVFHVLISLLSPGLSHEDGKSVVPPLHLSIP